jgi:hypothetical protein
MMNSVLLDDIICFQDDMRVMNGEIRLEYDGLGVFNTW